MGRPRSSRPRRPRRAASGPRAARSSWGRAATDGTAAALAARRLRQEEAEELDSLRQQVNEFRRKEAEARQEKEAEAECRGCHKIGHYARSCPEKKKQEATREELVRINHKIVSNSLILCSVFLTVYPD